MKVLTMEDVVLTYPQTRFEKSKKIEPSKIGPVTIDFNEKEVVGIYISGHPLDDFQTPLKHFCNVPSNLVFETFRTDYSNFI